MSEILLGIIGQDGIQRGNCSDVYARSADIDKNISYTVLFKGTWDMVGRVILCELDTLIVDENASSSS